MNDQQANNAKFVRRLFAEGWGGTSFDFLAGATAAVVPFHYNGRRMEVTPDSLPRLIEAWREAFPDLEMRVRHLVAQDDLVAVSLALHGTHRGEWWGSPPTGKTVDVEEMMFFRFEAGLLVEMWELFDEQSLRQQITE